MVVMPKESDANGQDSPKTPYGTSLLKAALILEYLAAQGGARGVSEIARNTGLSKATAFKLLETLQQIQYVEKKGEQAHYGLGLGLAKLAHSSLSDMDLVSVARSYLEDLNQQTGETIHLGIADGTSVVYVMKLESRQAIRMYSRVGISAPMYCTGIGKALLSTFDDDALDRYLTAVELRRFTGQTITTREELLAEIGRIRHNGYSIDNSEHEEDVRCIALPLYRNNRLYGAMSISAPSYRMTDETLLGYLPALERSQKDILDRLQFAR